MIAQLFDWISRKMLLLGGIFLVAMMALTCVDVTGRLFNHPVFGAYELVSFMAALVVVGALPDSHTEKRHIGVEIVVNKMSPRMQHLIELITDTISLVLFSIVAWRMIIYGMGMQESGEVSMNLKLPEYIIIYIVGFGFVTFCAAILKNILDTIKKIIKG
ncbi:MAG: TRAP transporter small permease [Desulfovermiculus sp.]|nr:TRAP transporter small permease [Desulfovermiculus sp.]